MPVKNKINFSDYPDINKYLFIALDSAKNYGFEGDIEIISGHRSSDDQAGILYRNWLKDKDFLDRYSKRDIAKSIENIFNSDDSKENKIEKASKYLEKNPISKHQEGDAVDVSGDFVKWLRDGSDDAKRFIEDYNLNTYNNWNHIAIDTTKIPSKEIMESKSYQDSLIVFNQYVNVEIEEDDTKEDEIPDEIEVDKVYVIDYDSGEPIKVDGKNVDANSEEGQILIADGTGYSETKSEYEARQEADPDVVDIKEKLKKPKRYQFTNINAYNKAKKEYEEALKIQKEKAEVIEEEETQEMIDDGYTGKGTITYSYGVYEGEIKDGKEHGQGTIIYSEDNASKSYVGEWKDGKKHGQGTSTSKSGYFFKGEFKDGDWHEGTLTNTDGSTEAIVPEDALTEEKVEEIKAEEVEEIKEKETIQLAIGKGDKGHLSNDQQNKLEELGIELQIRTDENGYTFYEIKADNKEEADKIMTQLDDAGFENQFIVGESGNEKKVEQQVENVAVVEEEEEDKELEYQVVLDADGNEIRIPIGHLGHGIYKNWEDVYKDDTLNRGETIQVGPNKYKWKPDGEAVEGDRNAGEYLIVDENGEFVPYKNNEIQLIAQTRLRNQVVASKEEVSEEEKKYSIGDVMKKGEYIPFENTDGNLISDQDLTITGINADGTYEVQDENGQITTINPADQGQRIENNQIVIPQDPAPIIKEESSRVTNADGSTTVTYTDGTTEVIPALVAETPDVTPDVTIEEEGPGLMQKIGAGVGATLKGAGSLLDSIGGPSAIISYIMGKEGLKHAMKEIEPQKMPELSPLFHQHLRQTKELAKKGFHPAEARKIRKEIDAAYEQGLDTAIRGTSGDRAKFLAQSGILDAKRSSALLDFATSDAALQRQNQDKYVDTMMFKENFEAQRSEKLRAEDMQMQLMNKQSAAQFTSAAFSNLMAGLGGSNTALIRQMMQMYQSGGTGTTDVFNTVNPK